MSHVAQSVLPTQPSCQPSHPQSPPPAGQRGASEERGKEARMDAGVLDKRDFRGDA